MWLGTEALGSISVATHCHVLLIFTYSCHQSQTSKAKVEKDALLGHCESLVFFLLLLSHCSNPPYKNQADLFKLPDHHSLLHTS